MKLYVKNITREPNDTLYTFLYRVLGFDGKGFGKGMTNSTYLDPKFINIQCSSNKYRSFDDIVLISKTYFKVSSKAVAKVIKRFLDDYNSMGLVLCDNIHKWVLYRGLTKSDDIKYCYKYKESDKNLYNSGKGVHSFIDIITLMGLTEENVKINN